MHARVERRKEPRFCLERSRALAEERKFAGTAKGPANRAAPRRHRRGACALLSMALLAAATFSTCFFAALVTAARGPKALPLCRHATATVKQHSADRNKSNKDANNKS